MALYLIGSVVGIALLVGLNILLFGRNTARLDSDSLAARLALDVPGFRAGASAISADANTALIENAADRSLYLARARGDKFVVRKIANAAVHSVGRDDAKLSLRFADFTFPKVDFALASATDASAWETRIRDAR